MEIVAGKKSLKKKTLVFLHYFGGAADSWKWVIDLLKSDYDCIALNLPGFGGAEPLKFPSIAHFAEFIIEELKCRNIKECSLVGHSMSGKIALLLASKIGAELVSKVVLVAPSPPTIEPLDKKGKEKMLNHPNKKEVEEAVEGAVGTKLSPERFDLALETQLMVDEKTWRWWILEGMNNSIINEITNLKIPISLIYSEDDPIIKQDTVEQSVIQLLSLSSIKSTNSVGHLIPLEAPEWLAEQIRSIVDPS